MDISKLISIGVDFKEVFGILLDWIFMSNT